LKVTRPPSQPHHPPTLAHLATPREEDGGRADQWRARPAQPNPVFGGQQGDYADAGDWSRSRSRHLGLVRLLSWYQLDYELASRTTTPTNAKVLKLQVLAGMLRVGIVVLLIVDIDSLLSGYHLHF
jgi:hypothetical protein